MIDDIIEQCDGFDWDDGNVQKNWHKYQVSNSECEEIFSNQPLLLLEDEKHSTLESRYFALGKTNKHRLLFIVFTVRNTKIRIISARQMNKKERDIYG